MGTSRTGKTAKLLLSEELICCVVSAGRGCTKFVINLEIKGRICVGFRKFDVSSSSLNLGAKD